MKRYAIVNGQGKVVRTMLCEEEQSFAQAQADEAIVENGTAGIDTHYFDGKEFAVIPPQPSAADVWDYVSRTWGDPRTLDERKADKWADMKAARAAAISSPLVTPFGVFDCDTGAAASIAAAAQYASAMLQAGLADDIDFTLADNSTVTLKPADLIGVGLLLGLQVQKAFAAGRGVRAQIEATTTAAAVAAVTWPT